jgi:hypothetical protein
MQQVSSGLEWAGLLKLLAEADLIILPRPEDATWRLPELFSFPASSWGQPNILKV